MNSRSDKRDCVDEIVNVEKHATEDRKVPDQCKGYVINVNGQDVFVEEPLVTRKELIQLAKVDSNAEVCVRVYIRGSKPRVLQQDEEVKLTLPGIERFRVDEKCTIGVLVNNNPLQLTIPTTGEKVKQAAIEAGISIESDFVLYLVTENGPAEQIDDTEVVFVDEGACFTAVDGDDNA